MIDFHPVMHERRVTVGEALEGVAGDRDEPMSAQRRWLWRQLKVGQPGIKRPRGGASCYFDYVIVDPSKPSSTVMSSIPSKFHWREPRHLRVSEYKRLGSFPDAFDFSTDDFNRAVKRIGNSVPPLLMHEIAARVRWMLDGTALRPLQGANYRAKLDDAWQRHIAPRQENAPTVVSTFAGCGGSSLGYSIAGFRELLAVEFDPHAVETFRRNFHDVKVQHGDIRELTVDRCLELIELRAGELDVFDGSPPCQGFSTSGRRKFLDSRNSLFREYVRLLDGLKPRAFVMENVKGMIVGSMRLIFAQVMRELRACGYEVRCRLLNAAEFGVPQARERLIFVGLRHDVAHALAERVASS